MKKFWFKDRFFILISFGMLLLAAISFRAQAEKLLCSCQVEISGQTCNVKQCIDPEVSGNCHYFANMGYYHSNDGMRYFMSCHQIGVCTNASDNNDECAQINTN